jgi:hypothetical protein
MYGSSKALMLAAAVCVPVIAAPSMAFGQSQASTSAVEILRSTGNDVIYLTNGTPLRGTIIEARPDVQARIQLATGEIVTIQWPQIGRIERGTAPSAPAAKSEPPSEVWMRPAPAAKPEPRSEVWVHLDASEGVVLQQDITNDDNWQTVCSAPCDRLLPTTFYYRVSGGGIKSSADFALHAPRGTRETLVVDGASKGAFVAGLVGVVGGPIFTLVGEVFVFSLLGGDGPNPPILDSGLAMMGIGVIATVGGIVLMVSNARTKVNQDAGASRTDALVPDSWTPTWNSAVTEPKNLLPIVGIPIFNGRF